VCTTGAHFVGACWKLKSPERSIALTAALGRSMKEQGEKGIRLEAETLSLEKHVANAAAVGRA
jgi:hypothetical protein